MLHTNVLSVDGALPMVGTAHLDVRSLAPDEQVCLPVAEHGLTATLDTHLERT